LPISLTAAPHRRRNTLAGHQMRYRYGSPSAFSPQQPWPPNILLLATIRMFLAAGYVAPTPAAVIGRRRVASQTENVLLSKHLRIHVRFTPLCGGNPRPRHQQIDYSYQDLLPSPLHTRSHASFKRTMAPPYTTSPPRPHRHRVSPSHRRSTYAPLQQSGNREYPPLHFTKRGIR